MVNVSIGVMPGRVNNYMLEDGTTVAEALRIAELEVGPEQDIKVDGEVASLETVITRETFSIVLAKRIKGAM